MTEYNLEKDHKELKKLIKSWELRIDKLIENPDDQEALNDLENISDEMMSINI